MRYIGRRFSSLAEARYLIAMLNSETTRQRAEHLQSRGQWGARHFDRYMLTLPSPVRPADRAAPGTGGGGGAGRSRSRRKSNCRRGCTSCEHGVTSGPRSRRTASRGASTGSWRSCWGNAPTHTVTRAPIAVAARPRTLVGDGAPPPADSVGGGPAPGTGGRRSGMAHNGALWRTPNGGGCTVHACATDRDEWREEDNAGHERPERRLRLHSA